MYNSQSYRNGYQNSTSQHRNIPKKVEPLDDLTYVKQAEEVIRAISDEKNKNDKITSSQIRILLSLINELYDMIRLDTSEKLSTAVQSHIQYIKMKICYQAGRETKVKSFVEQSNLIDYIDQVGDSRANLLRFCHYMESLVAFHKYLPYRIGG